MSSPDSDPRWQAHMQLIDDAITAAGNVLEDLPRREIHEAYELIRDAFRNGNKVMICGNGGSAAQAQHLAAEFVGHYSREREAMPAIALTTDTSALTAIGNDYGFDMVFSRQVRALASEDDVLIAFSTSGNSLNVLVAMATAHNLNMKVIGICGITGGDVHGSGYGDLKFDRMCDVCIKVPHSYTPLIQQGHMFIGHMICELIDHQDRI